MGLVVWGYNLDRLYTVDRKGGFWGLIPVQPTTKCDSAADRVTGVVKHMWNLRHMAQQFAIVSKLK